MSTIFGGGTSSASQGSQTAQKQANAATQRFIEQRTEQARADVSGLFPSAQRVAAQGSQGALDIIGQGAGAQIDAFTQGNVGAQQAVANTLPQFQNAILGLGVDQSAFQPVNLGLDASFLQGLRAPSINPQQQMPQGVAEMPIVPQISGLPDFSNIQGSLANIGINNIPQISSVPDFSNIQIPQGALANIGQPDFSNIAPNILNRLGSRFNSGDLR